LNAAAAERLAAGQAELDLGVAARPGSEPLPITSSRAAHLSDGYTALMRSRAEPKCSIERNPRRDDHTIRTHVRHQRTLAKLGPAKPDFWVKLDVLGRVIR
jgi:hypothetical protein